MFERLWEYLSRHVKIAAKSVFLNFKQYCCFFAAIFIIQLLYGMMAISATNNNTVAYQQIAETYEYHYVLYNLTQSQERYIAEYDHPEYGITDELKGTYQIVKTVERANANNNYQPEFDLYIRFGKLDRKTNKMVLSADKVREYCNHFEEKYVANLNSLEPKYDSSNPNFSVEKTLLLEYENRVASNNAGFWVITLLLLVLSVFLLMSIFNIRLNQYKFTYGVYMTFGADFKMLFMTSFWEMFVIMITMFVPATLISTLVVFLIYLPSGFKFAFDAWVILKLFVFSLVVVALAVVMPMRVTSMRRPMSLIITEDNSNLVSSPRKSFNLLGKKFPVHYEMYSIWRFRKYNIQLLSTAIVFCALFICGLYLANIYTTGIDYPRPQFEISINTNNTTSSYNSEMSETILGINEGFRTEFAEQLEKEEKGLSETFQAITNIEATGNATPVEGDLDFGQSPTTEAKYITSFMLVNKKNVKFLASGFFVYDKKEAASVYNEVPGSYKVTNSVVYKAVSPHNADDLIQFLSQYKHDGNYEDILKSDDTTEYCIIGDSISNISKFNFKVGDTVAVSTKTGEITPVDSNLTGKTLLRRQIKNYNYSYKTLTICAVIKDIPSGSVPVYMLNDAYKEVTGREPYTTLLNVYTHSVDYGDDGFVLQDEHIDYLENELREAFSADSRSMYGAIKVKNLNQSAEKAIDEDEHYNELFIAISVLILCISPIIWFFSQILFYFKREKEFNIIQSMGANGSDIRKIYLLGGISMSVLSFIVSILLSYVASYLMFYAVNVVIPGFTGEYIRYTFYMPWYALVISVVMSVACGFFSVYIPYKSYFNNRYSLENGGGGKDDE
ncbi:MAG: ABC transporter permease [Ruminococcaceae bacterium]|nr:ABC transporter permease [Oscillospiraceae bacterium]